MSQPLEQEQAGYNSPDGLQIGRTSTDLVGVYGAVPVTRYAVAGAASTYIVIGQSTGTASTYGFSSALEVTSLVFQVSTITVALRNLGLIT